MASTLALPEARWPPEFPVCEAVAAARLPAFLLWESTDSGPCPAPDP